MATTNDNMMAAGLAKQQAAAAAATPSVDDSTPSVEPLKLGAATIMASS
jgi:hypothetical protein